MKSNSIYIGNVSIWTTIIQDLSNVEKYDSLLSFFEKDEIILFKNDILSLLDSLEVRRNNYENMIINYPFVLPDSLKDLWLSGMIDFIEILKRLAYQHKHGLNSRDKLHYGELFYLPSEVLSYTKALKKHSQLKEVRSYIEERFEDEDSQDYYYYPNDEYGTIAPTLEVLDKTYLIADGEIDVNGSLLFMNTHQYIMQNEFEVALWSLSESTVRRYPCIAEMIMKEIIHRYFFQFGENKSDFYKLLSKIIKTV